MDSGPLAAKLRRDLQSANSRLKESKHDPRTLDVLVHEYRIVAEMALDELDRLQDTIYMYYTKKTK